MDFLDESWRWHTSLGPIVVWPYLIFRKVERYGTNWRIGKRERNNGMNIQPVFSYRVREFIEKIIYFLSRIKKNAKHKIVKYIFRNYKIHIVWIMKLIPHIFLNWCSENYFHIYEIQNTSFEWLLKSVFHGRGSLIVNSNESFDFL